MEPIQIQQVRRFNRAITQRAGALEDDYLRRGRPLGEARLLYEVGAQGSEVRALRRRLGLDSGYASRLLRSLEAQGLVVTGRSDGDGRRRSVALTARGMAERAAYDRGSDALARSLLARLDGARRARLVAAMAEVEELMRAAAVEVRLEAPTSMDARWCLGGIFHRTGQPVRDRLRPGPGQFRHRRGNDAAGGLLRGGPSRWRPGRVRRAQDQGRVDR